MPPPSGPSQPGPSQPGPPPPAWRPVPSQYRQQPYSQPPYYSPPYGQPQYEQPPYGQPPYHPPPYGQPLYDGPPYGQQPYGPQSQVYGGPPYSPQPYYPQPQVFGAPPYGPQADGEAKPPPHEWGFGAFLLAEAVFLLTSLIVPLVAVLPYALRGQKIADGAPLPGPVLIAALSIPPVLAAIVALLATKVRGNGPVVDLRLRFGWRDVGIGVACGFFGLFLTFVAGLVWVSVVGEDNANSAVGEVFDGLHMPMALAVLVFLDVWLLAPICEEILYRGLLWGAMERREWNRWIVLGVTTVVFALAHFEPIRAPLLLFIGLPIGMARLLSGRLAAPVIAHQINNFLPAIVLLLLLLGHPIAG